MNIDFWNLLYNHLEERQHDNIYQNVMQDADYLKFLQQEQDMRVLIYPMTSEK